MQKAKTEQATKFWQRMNALIGDERPYSWAENHGIKKSTFQSAYNRGNKPLSKTVELWAAQIGCSYEWLDKGIGEAFPIHHAMQYPEQEQLKSIVKTHKKPEIIVEEGLHITTAIDREKLQKALEITETKLHEQHRTMQPVYKAEFIVMLYTALIEQENQQFNDKLLQDVIYMLENELENRRRKMSPDKKTLLIVAIYTLYSGNASDLEAIKETTVELVRSAA